MLLAPERRALRIAAGAAAAPRRNDEFESVGRPSSVTPGTSRPFNGSDQRRETRFESLHRRSIAHVAGAVGDDGVGRHLGDAEYIELAEQPSEEAWEREEASYRAKNSEPADAGGPG